MFAQAHYRVALKVRKEIEKELGYLLHPLFVVGNISPDFTPKGIRQKHYLEEMVPVIVEDIDDLMSQKEELKKRSLDRQIGEICHFITDFFTLPHNERWEFHHSFRPHVRYEREINQLSKKGWQRLTPQPITQEVDSWLAERLREYQGNGTPSFDLSFAEKACIEFVQHVLTKQQSVEKKERVPQ